jgi:hypothetical protein
MLALAPTLKPASYRPVFQKFGRLHVPDVLQPQSAARLEEALKRFDAWTRTLTVGQEPDDPLVLAPEILAAQHVRSVEPVRMPPGRDDIEFLFDMHSVATVRPKDVQRDERLKFVGDFLNGGEFLKFARELTGDDRIRRCDVTATRYLPGHHLSPHNDANTGENRLYAYVLNLSRPWKVAWGGVLTFIDGDGHVAEGYTPVFNALNVFRVPQQHAVSMVNHLAETPRFSVTGWLHGPS